MQADEARNLVGGEWTSWRSLETSNLLYMPHEYGVYIIRATRNKIPRLHGHSDVIYVGEGIISRQLGRCLDFKIYKQWASESGRLFRFTTELKLLMEFSYLKSDSCKQIETDILDEYEKQHFELPPANLKRGKNSKWKLY